METIDLVVPAAGSGSRVGGVLPKQFLPLGGIPVMVHPLRLFATLPWIGQRIVVHAPEDTSRLQDLLATHGLAGWTLVCGGQTRQESMRLGLEQVRTRRVITHNAVVALVTPELITQVAAIDEDCVTTINPVQENLVRGQSTAEATVSRDNLCTLVSPQSFRTAVLRSAHDRAKREGWQVASDAELMVRCGHTVRLVRGSPRNFKITTALDLALAEALLRQPELGAPAIPGGMVTGQ